MSAYHKGSYIDDDNNWYDENNDDEDEDDPMRLQPCCVKVLFSKANKAFAPALRIVSILDYDTKYEHA